MARRMWLLLSVVGVLAVLVAACRPTPAPTTPPPAQPTQPPAQPTQPPAQPPAAEQVTIRVMVVDYIPDKTDKWLEEEVVPAFQKDHPNINVEFVYVNWGTLDETIAGYFAANEGADILNLGSEYVAEYGDRLAPLGAYFKDWPDWQQFLPGTLDTVMWEGEPRGLPWLTAPRAYMCRTDILAEVGWAQVPQTFEEMVKLAGDATIIKDGALQRQGFTPLDDWQEYLSLIWTLGGTTYKADGTPNFDSPEARAALQFMYDRRRAVLPNEGIAGLPETTGALLASDLVACQWGNLWGAPATSDPVWQKIELFPGFTHPDFPQSKPVVQVFNDWLAIPAYSKHIPEAVEFLKFLGSAENLNTYNSHFGSFPPRKDAWFGYVEQDAVMKKMGELMGQYGVGFADIRETAQFRDILMAEMPLYFTDAQDLDTTLQNIQSKYIQVLKDAGRLP